MGCILFTAPSGRSKLQKAPGRIRLVMRIRPGLCCVIGARRALAALLFFLVLGSVLVLVLGLVLILVLVLIAHFCFLLKLVAASRGDRMPRILGFILWLEKNSGE